MRSAILMVCTVLLSACTFNETTIIEAPGGVDVGPDSATPEPSGGLPPAPEMSADAGEGRDAPPDLDALDDAARPDVEDTGEENPTDAGQATDASQDVPDDDRPRSGALSFVEIDAPLQDSVLRLGSLALGDFIAEPDRMACGASFGSWAFADAFRVRNNSAGTLELRVAMSTVRDSPSLTLPEGTVYLYNEGSVARDARACSRMGQPADDHASALETFALPPGVAVEVLVVGGGPHTVGTYTVNVYAEGSGPDPQPDMEPDDVPPGFLCENTCRFANDNVCDDGGENARFRECAYGTDCADCGPRDPDSGCLNTCHTSSDGVCDDGGPGSEYSICDLGTDCEDCGTR